MRPAGWGGQLSSRPADAGSAGAAAGPARSAAASDGVVLPVASEQGRVPQGPRGAAYPDHLRAIVESYLESLQFATDPAAAGLGEAMRYSLLAGGKRIRPVLALST